MTRMTVDHANIPVGRTHGIVNWIFSSIAERDNYTGIVATDAHKVCYVQSGTGEYFAVSSVHPSTGVVTWRSLGSGGGGGAAVTDLSISNRNSSTMRLDSSSGADVVIPAATDTLAGLFTAQEKVKLGEVAEGATANSSDTFLRNRDNHFGTQLATTISNFAAAAVAATSFQHDQASALATWTVNHNLGYRPNISIYSTGGVEVEAEVVHISNNQIQVLFDSPFAGYAVCS